MISSEQQHLNDLFNLYYDMAKKNVDSGNVDGAKRNYLLAAEALLKQAKCSDGELRTAMLERAKRIANMANNLAPQKQEVQPTRRTNVPSGKPNMPTKASGNSAIGNKEAAEESDSKQWEAAEVPTISFADVIGLEDVKKSITTRMINPLKHPEVYAEFNKKTGGGVLLYGPPGTGKTMIAKAIAHEVGATFYSVKGSDIMSKWVGESEKNISSLFETAREQTLAIIFIDEMDSLFGERGKDTHNDKRVNEFLQQIDGFVGRNPNLLLLGATNRPWDIDGAAVRSGRFSEKIYLPLPDELAREFMLSKYLKGCPLADDINMAELVALTQGFSGADIDELCDRAKEDPLLASIASGRSVPITQSNLVAAISKVVLTNDDATIRRYEQYAGIIK